MFSVAHACVRVGVVWGIVGGAAYTIVNKIDLYLSRCVCGDLGAPLPEQVYVCGDLGAPLPEQVCV